MEKEQRLGIRTLYFYIARGIFVGLLLLLISLVIFLLQGLVIKELSIVIPIHFASIIISYFTFGFFLISVLLTAGGFMVSWLYYANCTFSLGEQSFSIRRGILSRKEISIPYRQIQDVDITQTFFHRLAGVSKLVILTAGNDYDDTKGESEGIFEMIDADIAEKVRQHIVKRTNVQMIKEIKD